MHNVNDLKIAERTFAISFLSLGVGSGISIFVTDTVGKIVSILVGIGFILFVVFGFHKRLAAYFYKIGGKALDKFLSIFMPLVGVIIFVLYPVLIGFVTSLGISVDASITIIAVTSGLLAIANLVVLTLNIVSILRRHKIPQE